MNNESWQNWVMYNATIPETPDTDSSSMDNKQPTGQSMSLWDIGQRILEGKGV